MSKPLAIVAGACPRLGQAMVKSLSKNAYMAFGLNRTVPAGARNTMAVNLADQLQAMMALGALICIHGAPKLVVQNTAKLVISPFEDATNDDFEAAWRAIVLSAINLANGVLPEMVDTGGGTFIVSGATATLRDGKNFAAFASAKVALRALTRSITREYGSKGVYVAHVILDGIVDTNSSRNLHKMDPANIADIHLSLANRSKSTWTHELDLRPMGETF